MPAAKLIAQIRAKIEPACIFKSLAWQTVALGSFELQRFSGAVANPIRHLSFEPRPPIGLSSAQQAKPRTLSTPQSIDDLLHSYSGDGSDICSR
jgi:hypothetical protein